MKMLVIQTAFLGDAILATALLEQLHAFAPAARLDVLVRKGNESLFGGHPFLHHVWVWDKARKYGSLLSLLQQLRAEGYDCVFNAQRFATMGLLTVLSGGRVTVGFDKNPFSRFFSRSIPHTIGDGRHEVQRNAALADWLTGPGAFRPRLYPTAADYAAVKPYQTGPYVCLAPTSVWFTKQWPEARWAELAGLFPEKTTLYLLGSPADAPACERIRQQAACSARVYNLCGKLSLLESAALMQGAVRNYVNDSAPMHLASAVNAPVTAIYCSTVPAFGFGPLSDAGLVAETAEPLACRPCGLHGHKACPEGHFRCGYGLSALEVIQEPRSSELP